MKIGFIGMGNMAKAMLGGILKNGLYRKEDIIGSALSEDTVRKMADTYGIETTRDNKKVAKEADIVVLAIKPQFFKSVIAEIRDVVSDEKLLISIAAGKSNEWIGKEFGKELRIVRCMPNTPALVSEGCTCVCPNIHSTEEDTKVVMQIMQSFGTASIIPERLIDAFSAVAGCSPAYVFMFIEAMADGAVAAGMPRKQAYEFAAQAVLGSAKMVMETGKHPGELKDMVCSPGGTTIQAVKVFEENGMRGIVMDAMEATINKAKML